MRSSATQLKVLQQTPKRCLALRPPERFPIAGNIGHQMLVSCRISQNTDDLFVCLIKDRSEDKLRRQKSSCCQTCGQLEQLQNIQTTPGKMCLSSGQRHVCNKARIQNLGRPYMDILESLTRLTTTKQITMCAAGHYKYDPLDCLLPERFSVLLPVE